MVNEQYNILSVSKDLGITKWEDFLAYIEKKGSASYGTSGVGAYANIKFQEVLRSIGIEDKYTIVPFDGGTCGGNGLCRQSDRFRINGAYRRKSNDSKRGSRSSAAYCRR